ncbi:MAG: radical SAM protein [Desulfobacterales bacterium]|nr:radical SAM protein [Desulfobacterales bacterium]
MPDYPYEMGPIRPVDEADSLLIRTTRGCPWNRCEFCNLYEGYKFSLRPVDEIKADIRAAREYFSGHPFETCFLQDGDSFVMRTRELIEVLGCLREAFPGLQRISSYGRAQTMVKKSPEAIKKIADAGLNKLYCGMESGSEQVLKKVKKGITPESIIRSARMARDAGMETTQFIILGLGGKELSRDHALETARVLNAANPDQIRLLTIGVKEGSGLARQMAEGVFTLPSEAEMIAEQRLLLENLEGITSHYANHHGIDLLLEIRGQLPHDRDAMLAIMDRFLDMEKDDQNNFILGRRLGYYRRLSDMENGLNRGFVDKQLDRINTAGEDLETVFHSLRTQIV